MMPNIDDLSVHARVLLGSLWTNPRFTLSYAMVESVPSDEAEAALDELVRHAILSRTVETSGAVTYGLTLIGVNMNRKPKGGQRFLMQHGTFPLSKPRKEARA